TLGVSARGWLGWARARARGPPGGRRPAGGGAARDSIGGAVAVAGRLGDAGLLASARGAYVHGMDAVFAACAAAAVAAALLLFFFQPGRARADAAPSADARESGHEHAVP
ncbi:hypothetical protein ABWI04_29080, partial [Actinomadura sp. NPDC000929]